VLLLLLFFSSLGAIWVWFTQLHQKFIEEGGKVILVKNGKAKGERSLDRSDHVSCILQKYIITLQPVIFICPG